MRHRIMLCTVLALVGIAAGAQAQQADSGKAKAAPATAAPAAKHEVKSPRDAASGMASGKRTAGANDEAAIREIDRKFVAAVAAKDTAYLMSLYASDAVLLPPNAAMVETREGIAKGWTDMMGAPGLEFALETTRIEFSQAHDVAYETGAYTYAQDNPKGGARIQDHGKYLVVWRKTAGGWQIVRDMWNSDVAMPGM
jgi:uncharacterized protein (TIGR02246 family)